MFSDSSCIQLSNIFLKELVNQKSNEESQKNVAFMTETYILIHVLVCVDVVGVKIVF